MLVSACLTYSPCLSLPDFNKKLAAMGFEISDGGGATYNFDPNNQKGKLSGNVSDGSSSDEQATSAEKKTSSASKQPSSIYRLVSKKSSEAEKPVVQRQQSSSSLKKVTFQEHNTSTESEVSTDLMTETADEGSEFEHEPQSEEIQSETQESFDDSYDSNDNSSIPESYKGLRPQDMQPQHQKMRTMDEDDDVSMSAFVPASVRRESVLPNKPYSDSASMTSEDSFEYDQKDSAGGSATSDYQSEQGRGACYQSKKYADQSTDESEDDDHKGEIDDLLDEAMDEVPEVQMRPKKDPIAAPVRYF